MVRAPCCHEAGLKKGAWTADEDHKLIAYIQQHGEGGWRTLPQKAGLQRCGKSCRLRWANYLKPDIKRGEFSPEEEQKIIQLHATMGNRWSAIARHLPKRTDNEIKNHWNTYLKKRLPADCHFSTSSSRPCSPHLRNNPAANLAPSQRFDELKANPPISTDIGNIDCGKDQPSSILPRPVSASARLLNKMATSLSLSSTFHCVDKLKSILSMVTDYEGSNVFEANNDRLQCSASASSLSSASISASSVGASSDQTTSISIDHDSLDQLIDPFDLDLFSDWQEASDHGVFSTSVNDTHDYNLESPASNYPPGISAYDEWTGLISEPFPGMQ